MKRREVGNLGERLAGEFLKRNGYRIRETNYRCPHGEIDIIAEQEDCLVFIEVRTKRSLDYGSPEESITPAKKERLRAVAAHYQQCHDNLPASWRIDVMAMELGWDGKLRRVELIEHAVGED